jgi:peptidoglycan-associated lipoprotein
MRSSLSLAAVLSAVALLAACSSQPPAPEQTPATVSDGKSSTVTTAPVTTENADAAALAALKDPNSPVYKRSVFFDYDQYVIKDEFKSLVEAHAKFLVKYPTLKMRIQGNADERGSREYNLALGQKRAEAMRKALVLLGARDSQIEAVSLGKEKPRCTESNETCWAQNRRGDMLYSGEF